MSALPRTWCPWCGNDVPIRVNRTFRQHEIWRDRDVHERCPASGLTVQEAQEMEDDWKRHMDAEEG